MDNVFLVVILVDIAYRVHWIKVGLLAFHSILNMNFKDRIKVVWCSYGWDMLIETSTWFDKWNEFMVGFCNIFLIQYKEIIKWIDKWFLKIVIIIQNSL